MPLAEHDGQRIFFAHVPKTGGSSIEDYLLRRFGTLSLRAQLPPKAEGRYDLRRRQGDIITPPQHMTARDTLHFLPARVDYFFAVVRDPLARILSEYRFQAGISRASRLGFSTWLRVMLRAAAQDPRIYENHIRPQDDLVPPGAEVFRFEGGFDPVIRRLDAVTGGPAPGVAIQHLLKSPKGAAVGVRRQDAALVARFYAADYARFGYAPPDGAALPDDPVAPLRDLLAAGLARAVVAKQRRDWLG